MRTERKKLFEEPSVGPPAVEPRDGTGVVNDSLLGKVHGEVAGKVQASHPGCNKPNLLRVSRAETQT